MEDLFTFYSFLSLNLSSLQMLLPPTIELQISLESWLGEFFFVYLKWIGVARWFSLPRKGSAVYHEKRSILRVIFSRRFILLGPGAQRKRLLQLWGLKALSKCHLESELLNWRERNLTRVLKNTGHVLLSQRSIGKDGYQGKAPTQCGRQKYMRTRTERWNCRKLLPVASGGWRSWLHVRRGK